ncbi:aminotransferase class I/II-fold pyridoxal phosphate-dependent enzyme [Halegenticoccus tardaugens]|uniref:aminotransferase class I/II-fold pyridoxal phosphate-dependent enzyme n=1 Tax=Halegenticoccus tardaugens TaxID=2071624 RepID=UPI00100A5DB3|nr:aminotransferase class I/II-fold pyridoxal phosphate-dependent enzyme [Halegenticoccus tardaugens]
MEIEPFGLERWFAEYEHDAEIMLAESGVRSLSADRFDTDPGDLDYVIPTNGDPELRATIADRYRNPGGSVPDDAAVTAESVLCTCGAQEANFLAFLALVRGDDAHAVVVTPTYQALHAVPDAFGDVTRVSLDPPEWTLDVDAVAAAIRPETRVVVLNNPNNPTGKYHDESTVRALYDLAADNGAHLLCDEVYRLLAEDPIPPVASMGPHGLSTSSVTKAHGLAGLRFGWLAGDREVIERAWEWKDYTTISPSLFGQHVAKQALGERERSILEENRRLAAEHRRIVREFVEARGMEWLEPVGVNGFVTVPDGFETGESFCRRVVETESVVLAPGDLFGFPGHFRIGFGLPTDELKEGLRRVGRAIDRA